MLFGLFIVFVFGIRNKNEMLLITQNVDDGASWKMSRDVVRAGENHRRKAGMSTK